MKAGTCIRFLMAIGKYGEVLAPKGGLGTVMVVGGSPGGKWGFLVVSDTNPEDGFGMARHEFEVVE